MANITLVWDFLKQNNQFTGYANDFLTLKEALVAITSDSPDSAASIDAYKSAAAVFFNNEIVVALAADVFKNKVIGFENGTERYFEVIKSFGSMITAAGKAMQTPYSSVGLRVEVAGIIIENYGNSLQFANAIGEGIAGQADFYGWWQSVTQTDAKAEAMLYVEGLSRGLDKTVAQEKINTFIDVSKNNNVGIQESVAYLNHFRKLLGMTGEVTPATSEAVYQEVTTVLNTPVYQSLKDKVTVVAPPLSATEARSDLGLFLSLYYLTPFALKTDGSIAADAQLTIAHPDLATQFKDDKLLTPEQRANGEANFSDMYLADRAAMLGWLNKRNLNDISENIILNSSFNQLFEDKVSQTLILTGSAIVADADRRQFRFGSSDTDTLTGGDKDDHLYGMGGADTLNGGKGNDRLEGGSGTDILNGGEGRDTLYGGTEADTLKGEDGVDQLYGGTGNDNIEGGKEADYLFGGTGNDTYIHNDGDGNDVIQDNDGLGRIQIKTGVILDGGQKVTNSSYVWESADHKTRYTKYDQGDGKYTLNILLANGEKLYVKDWQDGDLGISLQGATPQDPPPSGTTITENSDMVFASDANEQIDSGGGNDILIATAREKLTLNGGAGDDMILGHGNWYTSSMYDSNSTKRVNLAQSSSTDHASSEWRDIQGEWQYDYSAGSDKVYYVSYGENLGSFWKLTGIDSQYGAVSSQINGVHNNLFTHAYSVLTPNEEITETLLGGTGNDLISGSYDADYIDGGDDNDVLYGNAGNDFIFGGQGQDFADGGDGSDYIDGGAENDVLVGGYGADVIHGGMGDDEMTGDLLPLSGTNPATPPPTTDFSLMGNDILDGGVGNDKLWGGGGADMLLGGEGDDKLYGDSIGTPAQYEGDDILEGGAGNDEIHGDGGNDSIDGGTGADILWGDAGNDYLDGGEGDDQLLGGAGNDVLIGTSGDTLQGGQDDDTYYIQGGSQISDLEGRSTIYIATAKNVSTTTQPTVNPENQNLNITLDNGEVLSIQAALYGMDASLQFAGGEAVDVETLVSTQLTDSVNLFLNSVTLASGAIVDHAFGGMGNDQIVGDVANDTIKGYGGNDTLLGGDGNDVILGGSGNDYIFGGRDNDQLLGGAGDDQIIGDDGNDNIDGDAGDDTLFGEAGNDTISGGDGADQLIGDGVTTEGAADILNGGNGDDQLWGQAGNDTLNGDAGDDVLRGGNDNDTLTGGLGYDLLYGNAGNDTYRFNLGDGHDYIEDTEGVNLVVFGADINLSNIRITFPNPNGIGASSQTLVINYGISDSITLPGNATSSMNFQFADGEILSYSQLKSAYVTPIYTAPSSTVYGSQNDDYLNLPSTGGVIYAGSGQDNLNGGSGDDQLYGESGNDTLYGSSGNDTLVGGLGNDDLYGGDGSDIYIFKRGDGQDVIGDSESATDINTLKFGADILAGDVVYTRAANGDLKINIQDSTDSITIKQWYSNAPNQLQKITYGDGSEFDLSSLSGLTVQDIVAVAPSELNGTEFSDRLIGSSGNDIFNSGQGSDTMIGGAGNDTYQLDWSRGRDVSILDNTGNWNSYAITPDIVIETGSELNTIRLPMGLDFSGLTFERQGNDLYLAVQGKRNIDYVNLSNYAGTADSIFAPGALLIKDYYSGTQQWQIQTTAGTVMSMADLLQELSQPPIDLVQQAYDDWLVGTKRAMFADFSYSGVQTGENKFELINSYGLTTQAFELADRYSDAATIFLESARHSEFTVNGTYTIQVTTPNYVTSSQSYAAGGGVWSPVYNYSMLDNNGTPTLIGTSRVLYTSGGSSSVFAGYTTTTVTVNGYDTYQGFGINSLHAGPADNFIYSADGSVAIDAGAGNDKIFLGDFGTFDTGGFINAGDGNDVVVGSPSDDIVLAGNGVDFLAGGQGDDTYLINPDNTGIKVIDELHDSIYVPGYNTNTQVMNWPVDTPYLGSEGTDTVEFGFGISLEDLIVTRGAFDLGEPINDITIIPKNYFNNFNNPSVTSRQTLDITWGNQSQMVSVLLPQNGNQYDSYNYAGGYGVEYYKFADGTTLTAAQMYSISFFLSMTEPASDYAITRSYDASTYALNESWTKADGSYGDGIINADGSFSRTSHNPDGSYSSTVGYLYDAINCNIYTDYYDASGWLASDAWRTQHNDGIESGTDIYNIDGSSSGISYDQYGGYSIYVVDVNGDESYKRYDANGIQNYEYNWRSSGYVWDRSYFNADGSSYGEYHNQDNSYSIYVNDGHGNITTRYFDTFGFLLSYSVVINDGSGNIHTSNYDAADTLLSEFWTQANSVPLTTTIADQVATQDVAFNFQIPTDSFSDPDVNDRLTYTATLADGSTLPSWLTFDATTCTFNGTPLNDAVGNINIKVTAADLAGASISQNFGLSVNNINDAPTLSLAIPNQRTVEGASFSFTIPANSFNDIDAGDVLTYSINQADGSSLPGWLTFNALNNTLSGTPSLNDANVLSLTVTVTDQGGLKATSLFELNIANLITGTINNDNMLGTAGDDYISTGAGNDIVTGSAGNDTIVGGTGYDTLAGGLGNDTFLIDGADAAYDRFDGGDGYDTIQGGAGNDTIRVNLFSGTNTVEKIDGGTGQNILSGSVNNDTIDLSNTELVNIALIDAGAGNDVVTGSAGNDTIVGGTGYDTLAGGLGNDTFLIDGADAAYDRFDGGDGYDTIQGGAGNDTIRVNLFSGTNTVEKIDGGTGQNILSGSVNNDTIDLSNTELVNIALIDAGAGNDIVTGSAGNTIIQGKDGADHLTDAKGSNLLDAGAGGDVLFAGTGNDLLIGGLGNDVITTGAGYDVIVFNKGDGQDIVNASTGADNTISLGGNFAYSDLSLTKTGNDLILKMGATDQIALKDWYLGTTNHSVVNLQVIAEAMAGFNLGGSDVLRDNNVENFNFANIVAAFDAAGSTANWQLTDTLLTTHLEAGSDSAAIGGDLAYQYGKNNNLTGMGSLNAQSIISATNFGQLAQAVNDPSVWQAELVKLG